MRTIIVIPARYNSSRLPGKVLLDLDGKTIVQRVFEQCKKVKNISEVFIATDHEKVFKNCKKFTDKIILTSDKHESGTDRIAEVIENIDCDFVINVQGDEPFIDPLLIDKINQEIENNNKVNMISVMHKIKLVEDLKNPNIVKVVTNKSNEAIYFSRSIIPHHRDEWDTLLNKHIEIPNKLLFYRHLGIYGFKKDFLLKYSNMKPTYLERLEKLEQLRVIENGYSIKMIETQSESIGIDTIEDYEKAKLKMEKQK